MPSADACAELVDPDWYLASYPDVRALGADPVTHFVEHGLDDGRNPNGWFHRTWYQANYPEVAASRLNPLLHYLRIGAAALLNPHPRFDAAWYADQHPEAVPNPLLHHMRVGRHLDWNTEPTAVVDDYLPSTAKPLTLPPDLSVDVVIPVYRGLEQARRSIESVLADPERPPGRIIVVDDCSPEPELSAWIDSLAGLRRIERLRNRVHSGFPASANRGIAAAGTHDVVLLSSGSALPPGSLGRLAAQACAEPRVASVSPLTNRAELRGYPTNDGGPLPNDMEPDELDAICRQVNVGRGVAVPITAGCCLYIRREAIRDAGGFDAAGFGRSLDGQIDFCRRLASRGWRHFLACDTFVFHPGDGAVDQGGVGEQRCSLLREDERSRSKSPTRPTLHPTPQREDGGSRATDLIAERYPDYRQILAHHIVSDAGGPFRFAVTAGVFRQSGKPTILMVFHGLGGGARRQMMSLVDSFGAAANFLLLFASDRGVALTAPAFPDHPRFIAAPGRMDELVRLLRSCGVTRTHIHHLKGLAYDVRALIHRLGVPFDVTVHDYFAICPQVNLLPWPDSPYCREPGPAGCNACITARPATGATEILAWRWEHAWQFLEADRVFCPSTDVRDRLNRFGLAARAVVVPHEPVPSGAWPMHLVAAPRKTLRIALLGVLANLKGAVAVAALAEVAEAAGLEIRVIGPVEGDFPERARQRITVTGAYQEADLPALLAGFKPHVVWFPSPCPETYSYTLTTAIDAGLPIVATDIGSFPTRLAGRPLTWIVDPRLSAEGWLAVFAQVRKALRETRELPVADRPAEAACYARHYLAPPASDTRRQWASLRRPGRTSVFVIPARMGSGVPSPSAYLRLLQPLDHMARDMPLDIVLGDAEAALHCRADVIITQRLAVPTLAAADALARHGRESGASLIYDLEDDVQTGPDAPVLRRMLRHADHVFVPNSALAAGLAGSCSHRVHVVPDGLDERLWCDRPLPERELAGVVRVLLIGADTGDADLRPILPALARIKQEFGGWVVIEYLGPPTRAGLPPWIAAVTPPIAASASYPGFVQWVTDRPGWDIGLAPLASAAANRGRSAIKVLEYAALGMAVLASDVPAYRCSSADGPGGMLVGQEAGAWYASINWLIRNPQLRRDLAAGGRRWLATAGTLAAQAAIRRTSWKDAAKRHGLPRQNGPDRSGSRAPTDN